jgi:hypothetical protein
MKVRYPIGSHNAPGLNGSAIHQICDVRLLAGEAEVMMRFEQDEWYSLPYSFTYRNALSGGSLINITFPGEDLSIFQSIANPELTPSSDIYFEKIAAIMEPNKHKWAKVTEWAGTAFGNMLDGVPNIPPNPYIPYWYRLKYGVTVWFLLLILSERVL